MKYYLIAGERSGDLHGSNLIKYLKKEDINAEFRAIGGDYMAQEGASLLVHYKEMAVMGFVEVLLNLLKIRRYLNQCLHDIKEYQPDAIVFIDFAGFNLRIATRIHALNIRKFYYIPPKIWAWNQKRVFKIKKIIDKVFVILPFEEFFYKKYDVKVKYVGNPVLDAINTFEPEPHFAKKHQIIGTNGIIALLPGSRKQEILYAVPKYIQLARSFPDKTFGLSIINSLPHELYKKALAEPNIIPIVENNYNLLLVAEAAVVTSGTATLETAIFEIPQVVTYESNWLSYEIAKRLVEVKFISLVNLIADKQVIKEFIQKDFTSENLISELNFILNNENYRADILRGYKHIRQLLGNQIASENTAKEIFELLSAKRIGFI
jgi:lipid-A-disaccharide synthase